MDRSQGRVLGSLDFDYLEFAYFYLGFVYFPTIGYNPLAAAIRFHSSDGGYGQWIMYL